MSNHFTFKTLGKTSFEIIMETFYKSFNNYFVQFPKDNELFKGRFTAAGVDFNNSVGVFDRGELVAFIIHATGFRNDKNMVFNIATGVLKEYRGQGLVNRMYEFALPMLKNEGIEAIRLEVITENIPAINAYLNTGFTIARYLKCFKGKFNTVSEQKKFKKIPEQIFHGIKRINWTIHGRTKRHVSKKGILNITVKSKMINCTLI